MKDNEKIQVLLTALEERYSSIRIIRERVQTVSLRILGILFACAGYLFQADIRLCIIEKVLLLIILRIVYYVLHQFYFEDLKKGFTSQRKIAGEIEKILWFYSKAHFNEDKITLYPEKRLTGSEGNFFKNNNILVVLWFAILTLSIILYT